MGDKNERGQQREKSFVHLERKPYKEKKERRKRKEKEKKGKIKGKRKRKERRRGRGLQQQGGEIE